MVSSVVFSCLFIYLFFFFDLFFIYFHSTTCYLPPPSVTQNTQFNLLPSSPHKYILAYILPTPTSPAEKFRNPPAEKKNIIRHTTNHLHPTMPVVSLSSPKYFSVRVCTVNPNPEIPTIVYPFTYPNLNPHLYLDVFLFLFENLFLWAGLVVSNCTKLIWRVGHLGEEVGMILRVSL